MSHDRGRSSNSNHVNEFHHRDKEFDSVLNVIRKSNINPHMICLKRIIGEIDNGDSEFNSTGEFQKRLTKMCRKEINEGSANFDFDLLSMCCKEIINANYGSINFDKAALLLESSAQVYSGKVDYLHSLVSKALESIREKGQPEEPKNVSEQTEEDDSWVPDHMEVDKNRALDDTTTSSINLVNPSADVVLEGDDLDAISDGGQLQSSMDSSKDEAFGKFLKGNVNVNSGNSQSSESSDDVSPAHGGHSVPRDMHEDDSAYCHGDPYGYENQVPVAKIEECRHPHLDSPLANISESEKQAEPAAQVSLWKQQIKQDFEDDEAPPAFDINDYGGRVLQKLSQSADLRNTASLADVVQGEEKHDVARSFSALLHLVNDGNIDLQRSETANGELPSAQSFSVRLPRHAKRRQEVQFEASKKRAVYRITKGEFKDLIGSSGKENREPLVSTPTATNDNSPLSD